MPVALSLRVQTAGQKIISNFGFFYNALKFSSYALGAVSCATQIYSLYTALRGEDLLPKLAASLEVTVSVIALAARSFHHPLGLVISSAHGVLKELLNVGIHGTNLEILQLLQSSARLLSHIICLSVLIWGSVHMTLACSVIEILIGLYHLKQDLLDVHFLEIACQLILRAIDLGRL